MFNLPTDRYEDFEFLTYLDISDPFVKNYVHYNLGLEDPKITGRLKAHSQFYRTLNAPKNVQDIVEHGFKIPFLNHPPKMFFPNNKSSMIPTRLKWVHDTLF